MVDNEFAPSENRVQEAHGRDIGRYEQYDPYASKTKGTAYNYTAVKRFAAGVNYHPIDEVVVKAEYSKRLLKSIYNDEPSVSISVAYEGFFL